MAHSGIKIGKEVVDAIDQVKTHKLEACIVCINSKGDELVLVEYKPRGKDKGDVFRHISKDHMTDDSCCYAFFNMNFKEKGVKATTSSTTQGSGDKPIMITWISETCPIKQKMTMSSSKEALRNKAVSFVEFNWNEQGDKDINSILERTKAKDKTLELVDGKPVTGKPNAWKFESEYCEDD